MGNGSEQTEIKIGDIVEADWSGGFGIKHKGMVVEIFNQDYAMVRSFYGDFLCTNFRRISVKDLPEKTQICIGDFLEKEQPKGE